MELASTKISRTRRRVRFFTALLCILLLSWVTRRSFVASQQIISPIPDRPQPTAIKQNPLKFFAKKKNPDELEEKITQAIGESWNDYSLVVEDYTSDFGLHLSEGQIFVAASVNKIPIIAAVYYYAQKGEIDLDRSITVQANDIQDYGTGSIRYDKPGSVYTVKTLAKLMIKQSDNTAAYILANHVVGFPRLKQIVAEWGLTQTDMVVNKTSNRDIATLFRMIYENKVTDQAHTQEILSFLKDTDFETRIPGNLPDKVIAYHKIGTEVGVIHDAGIITDGKNTYYIGIFTNGAAEGKTTDELMAKVSKEVYDYMR